MSMVRRGWPVVAGALAGAGVALAAAVQLWIQPVRHWMADNQGAVLVEQTHALRQLRAGQGEALQSAMESAVWTHLRVMASEGRLPALLTDAVDYHCAQAAMGRPAPDAATLAQRQAWCQTLRSLKK